MGTYLYHVVHGTKVFDASEVKDRKKDGWGESPAEAKELGDKQQQEQTVKKIYKKKGR